MTTNPFANTWRLAVTYHRSSHRLCSEPFTRDSRSWRERRRASSQKTPLWDMADFDEAVDRRPRPKCRFCAILGLTARVGDKAVAPGRNGTSRGNPSESRGPAHSAGSHPGDRRCDCPQDSARAGRPRQAGLPQCPARDEALVFPKPISGRCMKKLVTWTGEARAGLRRVRRERGLVILTAMARFADEGTGDAGKPTTRRHGTASAPPIPVVFPEFRIACGTARAASSAAVRD